MTDRIKNMISVKVLAMVGLMAAAAPLAGQKTLAPELQGRDAADSVDVIVQYKHIPTDRHFAKVTGKGAEVKAKLGSVKGGAFAHLPASALADLAADPEVAYVSPDRPVFTTGTSTIDFTAETVNAPWVWKNLSLDGTSVGVAVIDSGIYPVADLMYWNSTTRQFASRIVYSQNFVDPGPTTTDAYGHGTHVAGIVAGAGWASAGPLFKHQFKGVAPNVNLINLRVLDQNGQGTDSSVIAAIEKAIELKSTYNIRVINLSLGRQIYESYTLDPLCQAVEAAWKAGIVVVTAAGNDGRNNDAGTSGYGTIAAPGNDPYVITVGAMNSEHTADRSDDIVTSYSSKGPTALDHIVKPDVVAPGNQVISLRAPHSQLSNKYPSLDVNLSEYMSFAINLTSPAYMRLSGTSMATPVVSGAAALMIQSDPTLTPDTVKARLIKTASKNFPLSSSVTDPSDGTVYTSYYDVFTVGAGYLDVEATLQNHDFVPSTMTAESPKAVVDQANGTVFAMDQDISVLWGSSVLWGATAVWGPTVFAGSTTGGQPIVASLDSSIVWSATTQDGFSVLWSTECSVLWGSSTVVGERKSALWGSGGTTSTSGHKSALWGSSTTGGKKSSALWGADVSEGDPIQP
jgi:serine protease AprX